MAKVPSVIDCAHAWLLWLVVIRMHDYWSVVREARLRFHTTEDRLGIGKAPIVERPFHETSGVVTVARLHKLCERV